MVIGKKGIDVQKLTDFSVKVLRKLGVPEEDAQITARMLVASDLRGVDSHGVAHLTLYAGWIQQGIINLNPKLEISSQAPSTAIMDGDKGLGFVVGYHAMGEAIRRAEKTGAGFVAVRNSTHFGASAYYAMMALEYNMIGLSMTSCAPCVVPPGSRVSGVGTNPLAVAVPTGKKPPFVLDMATSVVAGGKVEIALRKGTPMPQGWVLDNEGKPVTDPTKVKFGSGGGLLPLGGTPQMGGYKGFGLAIAVDILCGILSGSAASLLVQRRPEDDSGGDHFFGAIRIDGFLPIDQFKKAMDKMIEAIGNLPTLPNCKEVLVAGGYEAKIEKDRRANGIPLHPKVIQELQELAKEVGIEYVFLGGKK